MLVAKGDSGAWVVHHAGPQLYGHAVAIDFFGEAYVIPASDTLENVRSCLGAATVTLPQPIDFRTSTSQDNCSIPEPNAKELSSEDITETLHESNESQEFSGSGSSGDGGLEEDNHTLPPEPHS